MNHDQRQHREDDDANEQNADTGNRPLDPSHFRANHVGKRMAVAPRRQEKHSHILHGAGKDDPGEDPKCAGKVTHLRREHRANQWTGACDRSEVMPKQHVSIGRNVIEAVIVPIRRRLPLRINAEHFVGNEQCVEAVSDEIGTYRGDDEPRGVDWFPASERDNREGNDPERNHCGPKQLRLESISLDGERVHRVLRFLKS